MLGYAPGLGVAPHYPLGGANPTYLTVSVAFLTNLSSHVLAGSMLAAAISLSNCFRKSSERLLALGADDAVAGIDLQVVLYGGHVERLVAQPVLLRDVFGDLLGRRLVQPLQRLVEGVDERLHGVGVLLHEVALEVEHGRRHRPAQHAGGALGGAGFRQHHHLARRLQLGDDGIDVGDGVDLAALDGGNGRGGGAHADEGGVVGLEAGLGHQVPDDHVGGGAGRGDADLGALEVGDGLDLVGAVLLHCERNAGIAAELDDRQDVLALGLHPQRVLVSPGDDVSRPADQRRQRLRAALEVADLDVEALLPKVPELLGQRERQIIESRRPADAELDVLLLRRLRARGAGGQCDGSGGGNRGSPEPHRESP